MTQPSPHGYRDWGRYVAQSDIEYFSQSVSDIDAATDYGPFFVGDVPFIYIRFDPFINSMEVQLRFLTQQTGGTTTGLFTFDVRNGTNIDQAIPVFASWLTMRVTPNAINSQFGAFLGSAPSGGRIPGLFSGGPTLIATTDTNVNAGATSTNSAGNVWPGMAAWSVNTRLATWNAYLEARDYLGVFRTVDHMSEASLETSRTVFLPLSPMRIRFVNTTGAAGNVSYFLSAHTTAWGP